MNFLAVDPIRIQRENLLRKLYILSKFFFEQIIDVSMTEKKQKEKVSLCPIIFCPHDQSKLGIPNGARNFLSA